MWKLLLFCAIAQVAHTACPTGFDLIGNECRGTYATTLLGISNVTKITASMCSGILGQPVIIHNEEEQAYWANRVTSSPKIPGVLMLVIGLSCAGVDYRWTDGSKLDFLPRKYDSRGGNAFTVDVSCTTKLNQPVPSGNGCDSFDDDSEDGVCYQVFETAENREDAQKICKKFGANLATIHNPQENSFIRRLAVAKGAVNGLFLGATISENGKDFEWMDGSESDYENFYPGFPIPGIGNCVAMDTSKSAGQWMNIDCSTKLPVACIREQKEVTEPTCNGGLSTEGTVITSPGFPYNATTPCDYFLQVNPQQRVEVVLFDL